MRWKESILIALISFGVGFIVGWHPTFESVRNYVTTGISFAIVVGVITLVFKLWEILREGRRERLEKRKNHSKQLYTALHSLTVDLYFEDGMFIPTTQNEKYLEEAKAHIDSGYLKQAWEYNKRQEQSINNYNLKAQDFFKITTEKIIKELRQKSPSLTEWSGLDQSPAKYFRPKNIFSCVRYIISHSYKQIFAFDDFIQIVLQNNQWHLFCNGDIATSDNKDELLAIKQIITDAIKKAFGENDFNLIKKHFNSATNNHDLFVQGMKTVIKEVENDIPLEGECSICKKF